MTVEGAAISEDLRCPQCGRAVKSLICGHCGSRLPSWQADLYGAAIRQIAKLGGSRAGTSYQGGEDAAEAVADAICESPDCSDRPKDIGGASTPQWLFDRANQLAVEACGHPITLDVAAAGWNAKCDRFFSQEEDGMKQPWQVEASWCNPPFSASLIEEFVRKAIEAARQGTTTVCLLPWWNYPYLDLCEEHGRIHRICSPVSFRREDDTAFVMNSGYRSTPLVLVVFGPTIQPGFGKPIRKVDSGNGPQTACKSIALADECGTKAESHRQLSLTERAAILQAGKQCPEHGIVFTPKHVARFLFNLLSPLHPRIVLDAGSGNGDLSRPWRDSSTVIEYELGYGRDFSNCPDSIDADLVVCNPPFGEEKEFLRRILKVVPETTPIVLFATHRVRLGSYASSADWRWCRDEWPQISSIVSLPRGVFPGVNETVEILLFRMPHLLPHYFLPGDTE